ncbi:C40 family peptidase [Kiloniella sp. b19]|uniref:C40 family peptidase n=1 Tax=Kiloniella sp. GXU_MW_B19 TaxID=3141326 RepID=UPI0031E0549F
MTRTKAEAPDPRLHAFRSDLADETLKGQVEADSFVKGWPAMVRAGKAPLHRSPDEASGLDTELLYGEEVRVFEERLGWCWVQNQRDRYVGYVRADTLSEGRWDANHRVDVIRTFLYARADMKSPSEEVLHLTSAVQVLEEKGSFARLACGRWIFKPHLSPLDRLREDPLDVALTFFAIPYLWGGKSSVGLDCSGLVQMAMQACGIEVLRDAGQQETTLGEAVDVNEIRRGDIIYWPGHVGIAMCGMNVLHATAHSMDVCIEPIDSVTERVIDEQLQKYGDSFEARGITAVRRPRSAEEDKLADMLLGAVQ